MSRRGLGALGLHSPGQVPGPPLQEFVSQPPGVARRLHLSLSESGGAQCPQPLTLTKCQVSVSRGGLGALGLHSSRRLESHSQPPGRGYSGYGMGRSGYRVVTGGDVALQGSYGGHIDGYGGYIGGYGVTDVTFPSQLNPLDGH